MEYIDFHAHVFPPKVAEKVIVQLQTYYGYAWEGSGLCEDLLHSMNHFGVRRSVVFSSATKPEQVIPVNDYLAGVGREYAENFIPFGTMHQDFSDYKNEIARMKSLGLKGLKFHTDFQRFPLDSLQMLKIYEEIGDSLPLLFHIGDPKSDLSSPKRLAHVLDEMPYLKIIAAHFGGYRVWDEAMEYLVGRDLYLDTSSSIGFLPVEKAKEIVRIHGVDKMLFASDYPAVYHDKAIADVLALELLPEENEKVFHRNAESLLDLKPLSAASTVTA